MNVASFIVGWLVACTGAEPTPTVDTATPGACDTAKPRLSWETFGQGFLRSQCQGCHASTAADRFGAPENVIFDTEEDAVEFADRILARAAGPDADMPPAGGPSPEDRVRLARWIECDL